MMSSDFLVSQNLLFKFNLYRYDSAVFLRDVVACPNRAVGSGSGPPSPRPPVYPDGGGGGGGGGIEKAERLFGVIAFLSLGWAGTAAGLLRVFVLLRRERGLGGMGGAMSITRSGGRRHVMLQEDDDVEL
jgi:hypothetical protein